MSYFGRSIPKTNAIVCIVYTLTMYNISQSSRQCSSKSQFLHRLAHKSECDTVLQSNEDILLECDGSNMFACSPSKCIETRNIYKNKLNLLQWHVRNIWHFYLLENVTALLTLCIHALDQMA